MMTRPFDRRSIRLPGYDYGLPGAYFVTVCTHARACVLGSVSDGEVLLTPAGGVALACWAELPEHFPRVAAGPVVVLPNHVHGIVVIAGESAGALETTARLSCEARAGAPAPIGAKHASPLQSRQVSASAPRGPAAASLGAIIASYKSAVTRQIRNELPDRLGPVWQRGYYEHVVRDEVDWLRICEYIESNAARWDDDVENPAWVKNPARRVGLPHEQGKEQV